MPWDFKQTCSRLGIEAGHRPSVCIRLEHTQKAMAVIFQALPTALAVFTSDAFPGFWMLQNLAVVAVCSERILVPRTDKHEHYKSSLSSSRSASSASVIGRRRPTGVATSAVPGVSASPVQSNSHISRMQANLDPSHACRQATGMAHDLITSRRKCTACSWGSSKEAI